MLHINLLNLLNKLNMNYHKVSSELKYYSNCFHTNLHKYLFLKVILDGMMHNLSLMSQNRLNMKDRIMNINYFQNFQIILMDKNLHICLNLRIMCRYKKYNLCWHLNMYNKNCHKISKFKLLYFRKILLGKVIHKFLNAKSFRYDKLNN